MKKNSIISAVTAFAFILLPHTGQLVADAICAGDQVNIRSGPNIDSKIVLQCEFGEKIELVRETSIGLRFGEQYGYFRKVKFKGSVGYINWQYVTENFAHNPTRNYYAYSLLKNSDGATNQYEIIIYSVPDKSKKSMKLWASDIYFTSDANYAAVDAGTDVIRDLTILALPSFNAAVKATTRDQAKVNGTKIIFQECGGDECEETIFENGKIEKTGKKKSIKGYS